MFRVTIMGRDLKEFQENLRDYANVHAGLTERTVTDTVIKQALGTSLVDDSDEEMEEVESPYKATPSITPAAPVTPHVVDGQLDSEGLPWDERIHASSKALVKDGTWRTKRNLDENVLFQVRSELKAKYGTAAPVVQEIVSPVIPFKYEAPVAQPVVATPTPAPVAPAIPQMQTGGHTLDTFKANFPMVLAALINEQKINQEWVNGTKAHYGLAEIWQANDEQKAEMFNLFVEHGLIQRVG